MSNRSHSARVILELFLAAVGVLGFIVAANGFEDAQLETRRKAAEDSYFQLIENLGSDDLVVRIGAIGQIKGMMTREVPVAGHPRWWEGFSYVVGAHEHPTQKPYHQVVARMIAALALAPKERSEASKHESEAFIQMLCALGAEGWFEGKPRAPHIREECLAWMWRDAPDSRIMDLPANSIFRGAELRNAQLNRYEMKRADFSGAFLSTIDFSESDLGRSRFNDATIISTSFTYAGLVDSDFSGAILEDVDFTGADLRGVDFSGSTLKSVDIELAKNANLARGLPRRASVRR